MDAYILLKIIKMNNGYYILWYVWFWVSDIVLPMFWVFFTFILLFLSFCHVFTSLLLCNKIAPPFIFLALLTTWLCDYVPFMFSLCTRLVAWCCMYLQFDWRWYMERAWVFHLVAFFLWDDQWKYRTITLEATRFDVLDEKYFCCSSVFPWFRLPKFWLWLWLNVSCSIFYILCLWFQYLVVNHVVWI